MAFEFCLRYQRTTEFRRLCEIIRNHLNNIGKTSSTQSGPIPNAINLNIPESLQIHLETRFAQLRAATQLELWQVRVHKTDCVLLKLGLLI
jgi:translation initiation factor 3 subunit A